MMWADKCLRVRDKQGYDYGGSDINAYYDAERTKFKYFIPGTYKAVDLIDKDVIMMDWYWELIPGTEEKLLSKGFNVVYGNFSGSQMTDANRRFKLKTDGFSISNWSTLDKLHLQRNCFYFQLVYNAYMAWNDGFQGLDFKEKVTTVANDLYRYANYKILALPHFEFVHNTDAFNSHGYFVDGNYIEQEKEYLGEYVITYDDGENYTVPLYFGYNIGNRERKFSYYESESFFRFEVEKYLFETTYTCNLIERGGIIYDIFPVANPHPEKKVMNIAIKSDNGNINLKEFKMAGKKMIFDVNKIEAFQDVNIVSEGVMKARSRIIPFSSLNAAVENFGYLNESNSDRIMSLSGEWEFAYFNNPYLIDNNIIAGKYSFDKINVPSCWQMLGYENNMYVNIWFPIPVTPEAIPKLNPVGIYRKKFNIGKNRIGCNTSLRFDGVAGCYYLYVNGKYASFFTGSHNMSETDISSFLVNGENEITVIVLKWSHSSFLEGQDMFRMNGIFRDVFLVFENNERIYDYKITTYRHDSKWRLKFDFITENCIGKDITVTCKELCLNKTFKIEKDKESFVAEVNNVMEWSAEIPMLYGIGITLSDNDSAISAYFNKVGFKEIIIDKKRFLLNGQPIKLYGINRHDSSCVNGYAVTTDEVKTDIDIIKSLNCNTIRTSHYPSHPYLYELCDEIGIYVIDEADIEAHGAVWTEKGADYFSENINYAAAMLSRTERLYERDKNHACVIMWSIGNESGSGENQKKCYNYLKEKDNRPVHYERLIVKDELGFDVISSMYPSLDDIDRHLAIADRPYMMCEYMHSMGNGPGGYKEIFERILSNESFMGGCVWEFCDHAIKQKQGKYLFTYGGEHNEYLHDLNFCVDGVVYPDRRLSVSAYEMKNVYRPVRSKVSNGKIVFENLYYFKDTEKIGISWELLLNGIKIKEGTANLNLKAREKISFNVPEFSGGEYILNLRYVLNGADIGRESHILCEHVFENFSGKKSELCYTEYDGYFKITVNGREYTYDKTLQALTSAKLNGREFFNEKPYNNGYNYYNGKVKGFFPTIFRGYTDNDMYIKKAWTEAMYDKMWLNPLGYTFCGNSEGITFSGKFDFTPPSKDKYFDIEIDYTFKNDSSVKVDCKLIPIKKNLPPLMCFGMRAELDGKIEKMRWYGLGENENYCDFRENAIYGVFDKKIPELYEDFIVPQYNGNRGEIRFCEFSFADGFSMRIEEKGRHLNVNASRYTRENITQANHIEDLKPQDTTEISVDGFQRGLGSESCGQLPLEKYTITADKTLEYSFIIVLK